MRVLWFIIISVMLTIVFVCCSDNADDRISFYRVQSAGADTFATATMQPFFIATTIQDEIYQAWVNRQNTVVAVMRVKGSSKAGMEQIMRQLFTANNLSGKLITDEDEITELKKSLKDKQNWLTDTEAGKEAP